MENLKLNPDELFLVGNKIFHQFRLSIIPPSVIIPQPTEFQSKIKLDETNHGGLGERHQEVEIASYVYDTTLVRQF